MDNPFFYEPRLNKKKKKGVKKLKRNFLQSPLPRNLRNYQEFRFGKRYPLLLSYQTPITPHEKYAHFALQYMFPSFQSRFYEAIRCLRPIYLGHPANKNIPDFLQSHRCAFLAAFIREYRLRFLFKCFFNKWRLSRYESISDTDPITLATPTKPIFLYQHSLKKKYIFDGNALAMFISSQLMLQRDGFAIPTFPKNPFTNLSFSVQQMRSLCLQLKDANLLNWQIHLFQSVRFNIEQFKKDAAIILTKQAIKTDVYNYTDDEAQENFRDFILDLIDEAGLLHDDSTESQITNLMKKFPQCFFINFFRKLYVREKWAEIDKQNIRGNIIHECRKFLNFYNCAKVYVPDTMVNVKTHKNLSKLFGCDFMI